MKNKKDCAILLSNHEHAVPHSITDTEIVQSTRQHKLGNGFCCWLDHMQGKQDIPEPEEGEYLIATFWPNNPYNERRAPQRNMSVNEFIELRFNQICDFQQRLGERFYWCIGWETFQSGTWCDKNGNKPIFFTPKEGFEFYRKWLTTNIQNLHWRNCLKFGEARFNKRPSAPEYLKEKGLDPDNFNLVAGDTIASRAHHAFEALPEIKAFWWECGISTACLQVGIPFVRGACRQYKKKWIADVSPYSYPYPIHEDEFYCDLGEWGGFEEGKGGHARLNFPKYTPEMVRLAGYTPEMLLRCWMTALMAGCDFLFQEASSLSHFVKIDNKLQLTPIGKAAKDLSEFNLRVERGKPLTPVTLLLDQYHGIEPYFSPRPWQFMPITPAVRQVSAFFEAAYPGHSLFPSAFPWKGQKEYGEMLRAGFDYRPYERRLVCPGHWPDIFNVITTNASREAFEDTKIIIALGPHDMKRVDGEIIKSLIEEGRTFVCTAGLGLDFGFLPKSDKADGDSRLLNCKMGKGEVFYLTGDCGLDNEGNISEIMVRLLDNLISEIMPFEINGNPVQWSANRTRTGYQVMLINHGEKSWWGEILWKSGKAKDVRERWKEQPAVWRRTDEGVLVKLGIAPYEPGILEFYDE